MTNAVDIAQSGTISSSWRNRIINGGMMISQGAAGATITPAVTSAYVTNYPVDRFQVLVGAATKLTTAQSSVAPAGFNFSTLITSTSAYTVGAGEVFVIRQNIEGFNTADLAWGTANAQTITLTFWVRSSITGTFGGSLQNSASNRSYPFTYTINSANTWEFETITIAGDTTGTWIGATNDTGIRVNLGLGVGSTFSGTAGAWSGSDFDSATGATSVVGTNGATFYVTGVQLEAGSAASPFDYRDYGRELIMCQRYFETNYSGVAVGTASYAGYIMSAAVSNTVPQYQPYGAMLFNVAKRTAPTVTLYGNQGGSGKVSNYTGTDLTASSGSVNNSSIVGFNPYNGVAGTLTTTFNTIIFNYTASAEL
jgi:hypothetical protein